MKEFICLSNGSNGKSIYISAFSVASFHDADLEKDEPSDRKTKITLNCGIEYIVNATETEVAKLLESKIPSF